MDFLKSGRRLDEENVRAKSVALLVVLLCPGRVLHTHVLDEGKVKFQLRHAIIVGRLSHASTGDQLLYTLHRVVQQGEHGSQCINFSPYTDQIDFFLLQNYLGVFHGSSGRSLKVYP
jgi:hypothetical protein